MKKKIIFIIAIVVILFGCYNLIWYFGVYRPYNELQIKFPEIEESGKYIYTDEEGFQYSVAVPNYLLWNGNLAIAKSDVQYALIVWLKPFQRGTKQGVIFSGYDDLNTQIMLKNSRKAEDQEDQSIVEKNSSIISMLFHKANKVWNLELE